MKTIVINFINKQKKILKLMGITLFLFFIDIFFILLFMVNNQEAVSTFIVSSELSKEIIPVTILIFVGIGLGIFFLILFSIFIFKVLIPNSKTLQGLTMKDEINFLLRIPNEIQKEVRRNGK